MNRYRRSRVMALAAAASVSLVAACGAADDGGNAGNGGTETKLTVALVSPQASGDKGAIDALLAGMEAEAEANDMESRFVYVSDPSTAAATLTGLAKSGTDIILTAFAFSTDVETVAAEFPETKFLQLLAAPVTNETDNNLSLVSQVIEPYYLAGVASGALSASGRVGYIGGSPSPLVEANANAMGDGVHKANPAANFKIVWANSFQDPAKGQQLATALFSGGTDIVLPDASGTNGGVYETLNSDTQNVVDVSVNGIESLAVPARTPGVIVIKFEQVVHIAIEDALKADMPSGTKDLTYADDVADFVWNPAFEPSPAMEAKLAEAQTLVADLKQQLLDGTLKLG